MGEDDLGGSTKRFSPQMQIPRNPTREPEGPDGVDVGEHPPESMTGNKTECITITHIRATDVAIRLRLIPVGFYAAVKIENVIKRTSIKPVSVSKDVVEWDDKIILLSNRTSRISITVLASFELGPTLGGGEALRKFETTVGELLDCNGELELIRPVEQCDGEVDSSCSSFQIKTEGRVYGRDEYAAASNLPESEEMRRLRELTDKGHHALICYRELQEERHLGDSIRYFEHAQDLCPPAHPGRAAALFNLATAKLIYCRINGSSPDLDVPINLYREVLRFRPRGHPDHPLTLLSLGVALEARFQRQHDEADGAEGKTYLSQVLDVAQADSYAYHAAVLALGNAAKPEQIRPMEISQTIENDLDGFGGVQRLDAALQWVFHPDSRKHALIDHIGILFCTRFNCLDDFADPEKATSTLEAIVQFTSENHPNKASWLDGLGALLWIRYEEFGDRTDLEKSISMFEDAVRLTPGGHSDKPSRLTNLGSLLSTRYRRFGDVVDLKRSISVREDALQFTPDGHSDKAVCLNNLGRSLWAHYNRFGDASDLERSISLAKDALQITPDGHADKPIWLNNLGNSLSTRYECFGDTIDLERLISLREDVLQFTPDGYPHKPLWLNNLGDSLSIRYERFGDIVDLERSISSFEAALQCTPEGHPDKPLWLNNLGCSLSSRYKHFGDIVDLERSISLREDALRRTPDGHAAKPSRLNNLSRSLSARYERFGDIMDLGRSIALAEDVLRFTPDGHPDKPSWLNNLGRSLSTRYERFGDIGDLKRSISLTEDALQFTPDGHPDKPLRLNNLGNSLLSRYQRFGDVVDLERSISLFEDTLQFTPDGHPEKSSRLNNLGSSLSIRYKRFGDIIDLERSISLCGNVVQLTPDGHPHKPLRLDTLGHLLLTRYERLGDVVDLERSISLREDAVQSTPDGHPDKPSSLNNLGSSLWTRYERFGDTVDLERSISLREDAVQFTPNGHSDKPSQLNNLSHSLSIRYKRFGDIKDLERSVSVLQDAVQLTPDGHPDKSIWLNNLVRSLSIRYKRFGDIVDLERSISLCGDVVQLTPDDHPRRPSQLDTLGHLLLIRYERLGDVVDLERSISLREDAVQSTPDGHGDKPVWLNNLSHSFSSRYERFGDIADLERSISALEDVVQSTPDDHIDKPTRLGNLGYWLSTRYERFGDIVDLDSSISLFKDALQCIPDDHLDKPFQLNNLGHSLSTRYKRSGDIVDLERSISLSNDALQSTPDGHPEKPSRLNNLGSSLSIRYRRFGDIVDLERSFSLFEDAVRFTPDDHIDKTSRLKNFAVSFFQRFRRSGDLSSSSSDLSQAILHASRAACSPTGPSPDRFEASQLWIRCLRLRRHDSQSLLDACTVAVDLLPQLAWMGLSLHDRHHKLLRAADETCSAAAAALEAHKPELAVEWLEQGRSIVWSQLSQLRKPIDDLRIVCPELATQFERVSHELEHASVRDRGAGNDFIDHSHTKGGVLGKQARQHHTLAVSRERLLAKIRVLPSFERFLLPKTFRQLASLAHPGPVVFLNANKYRCDALVVVAGSEYVRHVPLSNTNYNEVADMQRRLKDLLALKGRAISRDDSPRGARPQGMTPDYVFRSILPYLWEKVVSPILQVLPLSTSARGPKLPRIFWCPTGPFSFLPVHAAGLYGTSNSGPKLSDFAISSYIPTMSALEVPPQGHSEATPPNIRLLAVPQPSTDGQNHLTGARGEIEIIGKLASSSPFVGFQEADGTVEDVLSRMKETNWVHFACHGTQDRTNPLDSGFLLAQGRRLKLTDIARVSRPHGGLAFLSACQTATGDEQLSEEAIHIAAGMLLAGYRGAIATMWTIMDNDAPRVTEDVYKSLLGDGKVPDSGRAAEALHHAIERLRDSGVSFLSWVPFIHVGI